MEKLDGWLEYGFGMVGMGLGMAWWLVIHVNTGGNLELDKW